MNRITGEKRVSINGQDYIIRFTWRALAEIESEFGDSPNLFNAEVLSKVASAGLRDKYPEMTAEKIMEISPPIVTFARAVQEAIQWAYFGAESLPRAETSVVKKNSLAATLSRLIKRLLRRG